MTSDLEARLARQGLIWDNLHGRPASQAMVDEVRRLVADGTPVDEAVRIVEGDDDEGDADDFIVPRHG